jgi:O-methyltransferase involved in polyketide biosynthesis
MEFKKNISESAFLVNESRARNIELSQDLYAHLWVSNATRTLWEDFSREVYPHDATELGARNRFFLEQLRSSVASGQISTFINFGAGFTSYPFLIEEPCRFIEIDFRHVVDYKQKKIARWQRMGLLPEREIFFLAADLNEESDIEDIWNNLVSLTGDSPSLAQMEGITYYLENHALNHLFKVLSEIQARDSILIFDFWTPDVADHPVTIRFKKFFAERFGHKETEYNLIDSDFINAIRSYEVIKSTNIQELERLYAGTSVLSNYEEILPENYAVLKKI